MQIQLFPSFSLYWYILQIFSTSFHFRCVAITLPLKKMEWMSVKSAKTKIIPLVILFNILYSSYTVFLLVKANPEKFGCIRRSTNPIVVRNYFHCGNFGPWDSEKFKSDFLLIITIIRSFVHYREYHTSLLIGQKCFNCIAFDQITQLRFSYFEFKIRLIKLGISVQKQKFLYSKSLVITITPKRQLLMRDTQSFQLPSVMLDLILLIKKLPIQNRKNTEDFFSQTRIGLVMTLVIDIAIPFGTISVLNAILISAVRQRNRNLNSFGEITTSNKSTTGELMQERG